MAEGSETYNGLGVPLFGESEIQQQTVGNDILTLTGAASMTGDFLVLQTSAGVEKVVIESTGDVNLGKTDQTTFVKLNLPILDTAPSSAGLTKGDVFLAKATTDVYRMVLCISTATGAVRYANRITRSTLSAT